MSKQELLYTMLGVCFAVIGLVLAIWSLGLWEEVIK